MSWFVPEDRVVLRRLADCLIPEGDGMPSGSTVGAADELLDSVINFQAHLAPLVLRAVRVARAMDARPGLEKLQQVDPEAFDALKLAIAAGYYMHPKVRTALGYTGVERRAYDPNARPEFEGLGLLSPVTDRGPIWRPDPRHPSR